MVYMGFDKVLLLRGWVDHKVGTYLAKVPSYAKQKEESIGGHYRQNSIESSATSPRYLGSQALDQHDLKVRCNSSMFLALFMKS